MEEHAPGVNDSAVESSIPEQEETTAQETPRGGGEQALREKHRSPFPEPETPGAVEETPPPSNFSGQQTHQPKELEPTLPEGDEGPTRKQEGQGEEQTPAPEQLVRAGLEKPRETQAPPIIQAEDVGPGPEVSDITSVADEAVSERQRALKLVAQGGLRQESGG